MAGTNTEKIDQIVQQLADVKATLRIFPRLLGLGFGLGFPVLIALTGYLVTKVHTVETEIGVIDERLRRIEESQKDFDRELRDHRERIIRLEASQPKKP